MTRAYRHALTLQRNNPSRSARGAEVDAWIDVAQLLGDVSPLSSREFYAAQQVNSEITYEVHMHYRPDVSGGMRLVFGDLLLEIVGPPRNPGSRNRKLIARCRVVNE